MQCACEWIAPACARVVFLSLCAPRAVFALIQEEPQFGQGVPAVDGPRDVVVPPLPSPAVHDTLKGPFTRPAPPEGAPGNDASPPAVLVASLMFFVHCA